jgi:hypothetical protein
LSRPRLHVYMDKCPFHGLFTCPTPLTCSRPQRACEHAIMLLNRRIFLQRSEMSHPRQANATISTQFLLWARKDPDIIALACSLTSQPPDWEFRRVIALAMLFRLKQSYYPRSIQLNRRRTGHESRRRRAP